MSQVPSLNIARPRKCRRGLISTRLSCPNFHCTRARHQNCPRLQAVPISDDLKLRLLEFVAI